MAGSAVGYGKRRGQARRRGGGSVGGSGGGGGGGGGVNGGGVVGLPRLGEGRRMLVVALGVGYGVEHGVCAGGRVLVSIGLLREAGKVLQAGCCREKEMLSGVGNAE